MLSPLTEVDLRGREVPQRLVRSLVVIELEVVPDSLDDLLHCHVAFQIHLILHGALQALDENVVIHPGPYYPY